MIYTTHDMASQAGVATSSSPVLSSSSCNRLSILNPSAFPVKHVKFNSSGKPPNSLRFQRPRTRAAVDGTEPASSVLPLVQDQQPREEVEECVQLLKTAAKTRKVPKEKIIAAMSVIEKAKLDPSGFLQTLGGSESPGRTWMLIFTAEKQLKGGRYFPVTAVQRFDAAAMRIENGVYLGPVGSLAFEGKFSWKNRILAFIFELIRIKVGPLKPLEISLGQKEDRKASTKDPFFIWFYVDEELAVARGRSGGTAFWCRCKRITTS